jgi:hypothetical protein
MKRSIWKSDTFAKLLLMLPLYSMVVGAVEWVTE